MKIQIKIPIYDNSAREEAFRNWQNKYNNSLLEEFNKSQSGGFSSFDSQKFDKFCLERYTGRTNFSLTKNKL